MTKYIALQAIQVGRKSIEPRALVPSKKGSSGLFDPADYGLTSKQVKALVDRGAIRETEGTEHHEDPAKIERIEDRVIDATAKVVEPKVTPTPPADEEPDDDLKGVSVSNLKKIAEAETIDLGEATKSADIKSAIRAARVAKAAAAGDEGDELLDDE